jgi:hypothetical protein
MFQHDADSLFVMKLSACRLVHPGISNRKVNQTRMSQRQFDMSKHVVNICAQESSSRLCLEGLIEIFATANELIGYKYYQVQVHGA